MTITSHGFIGGTLPYAAGSRARGGARSRHVVAPAGGSCDGLSRGARHGRPYAAAVRAIGSTGLAVHPLCLGGNVFGWTLDEPAGFAVLDAFVEGGGTFIDTADVYATWVPGSEGGDSERMIGAWLRSRGCRDDVVLATKVGAEMGPGRKGLAPAYVRGAVEDSLRRLGVECVDLLYAHYDDPATPVEDALWGLDELVRAGKVRALGASNFTAQRLAEFLAVADRDGLARFAALQPEYNLLDRDGFEGELAALCVGEGLGVMPYYALANGLLSGKYRRDEPLPATARGEEIAELYLADGGGRAWDVVDAVIAVAARHGATPAQVAIAWLASRPGVTAPIASATSPAQVSELLGATALTLDTEDMDMLDITGRAAGAGA
jgi:aryl-alcohol dehydrogenase-like predicted oxidoreductase